MGFLNDLRTAWRNLLTLDEVWDSEQRKRLEGYALQRDYYRGAHRQQLKVRTNQADDNISLNFIGLVVDRGISMLLGEGIEFDMGGEEEEDERQEYIDDIWLANKKDILLHKSAQYAGNLGTGYIKIMLDSIESRSSDNLLLPRLVPLDPLLMEIITDPEDIDTVHQYVMRFNIEGADGQKTARREITERVLDGAGNVVAWEVSNYFSSAMTGGQWQLLYEPMMWEYEFPPILHWQNLPLAGSVYGKSDVIDIIDLQDRINFIASNISKIIRYHAHPKTWGRNVGTQSQTSWGADEMITFQGENALIDNLEMQSDLQSSQAYLLNLRQTLFDISRTVDITSMSDKLGALTNFGLRVLFYDSIAKLSTKQELYGEALQELNHRLLVVGEKSPTDGGAVVWPETLPENQVEEVQALQFDLGAGLVSKETAARERGYDWEVEQERIGGERVAGENIGSLLLQQFERGG